MDFAFSEEQQMLRASAVDFLQTECPRSRVRELEHDERGYDPSVWRRMAQEMGWMGLVLPEQYGGVGGDLMDLAVLLETMGATIVPGPFFPTVALCALPILQYGTERQKERYLPGIARGEQIWTLALTEPSVSYQPAAIELTATQKADGSVLSGSKFLVPYAHVADHFLVVARTGDLPADVSVFIVDAVTPGLNIEVIPTMARDKQCMVAFDGVEAMPEDILGETGRGWDVVDSVFLTAGVLKSAEMLGACDAMVEMTTEYMKTRVQFDRPIGSFQALQHRIVDRFMDVEGLRHLVHEAAWALSSGAPSRILASMAKAKANEVFQRTCIDCIKNYGAIGFTADQDIGLYYRRVKAAEFLLGDSDFHREKVAVELGL